MTSRLEPTRLLIGVGVTALASTTVIHLLFIPQYLPGYFTRGLPFLTAGWVSYFVFFYALGRLRSPSGAMPDMRATDVGVALFLFAIVLSGILDTAGITLESNPIVHVPSVIAIYLGLALAGWGFGARTELVNRMAAEAE